jgi:GABA(A) receptor-associated protein
MLKAVQKTPVEGFPLDDLPLEKRKKQFADIIAKYPDRIPVLVKRHSTNTAKIDKGKFLIPADSTFATLMFTIRQRIKLPAEKALFIFVNDSLPKVSEHIGTVYDKYKSPDGFLRVVYSEENTFGK